MDDERFYNQVAEELRNAGPKEGLWLQALTESDGDEKTAKILYLRLRVNQLKRKDHSQNSNIKANNFLKTVSSRIEEQIKYKNFLNISGNIISIILIVMLIFTIILFIVNKFSIL